MEPQDRFKNKLVKNLAYIGAFFLVMSIVSTAIGKYIDNHYDVKPYGSIGTLLVSLVINWVIIYYVYVKLIRPIKKQK